MGVFFDDDLLEAEIVDRSAPEALFGPGADQPRTARFRIEFAIHHALLAEAFAMGADFGFEEAAHGVAELIMFRLEDKPFHAGLPAGTAPVGMARPSMKCMTASAMMSGRSSVIIWLPSVTRT